MYKNGTVISTTEKFAVIEVMRANACGENCTSCIGGCKPNGILIEVENSMEAHKGDIVRIDADTKKVLEYSSIVYMIPLFFMMLGIIGTLIFSGSDVLAFAIGALLLTISILLIHKFTKDSKINFRITHIIHKI